MGSIYRKGISTNTILSDVDSPIESPLLCNQIVAFVTMIYAKACANGFLL